MFFSLETSWISTENKVNIKRYIVATIALFLFIFLYEGIVHGYLLLGEYLQTSTIWRDFDQMETDLPLAMCFQFALSAWLAFVFTQIYEEGGLRKGVLFGIYFGVFAGILTASWYLWLPVPAKLGLSWFVSSILEGLGGGLVLGSIYRK
jgi:hypothetical protein